MNAGFFPGHQPSGETLSLVDALLDFIDRDEVDDAAFDALAARLFAHQYASNAPYRRFCQGRGITPRQVATWRAIPAVPISAFKEVTLSCEPAERCERVFMTSGTTGAEVRGRHYHPTLSVYDRSMTRNFERRFMAGRARMPMATLFPSEEALPNSSLAHYLSLARSEFGTDASRCFVGNDGLHVPDLRAWLRAAVARGEPCALLGASYSFVHLLDAFAAAGESWQLPAGSRILDTGGYKNHSRELSLDDFYDSLSHAFGVPRAECINMYGMTELSTQYYDDGNATVPPIKSGPHWIRSRTIDPSTGADVAAGERGVLVHCDLASFNSVTAILTEDLGLGVGEGFRLLGRVQGAQAKGCSLAVEEFLKALDR